MFKLTPEHTLNRIKVLVYGPQGAGKTVLSASAQDHPAMSNVLFLDCDGGLMSIASRGDIMVEKLNSIGQLEDIYWKLFNKDKEYADFKTVVIDSATELQTMNLEELMNKDRIKNKDRAVDETTQRDYGKSTTGLKRLFRFYRDLPLNVIFTALPKRIYDRSSKQEESAPIEIRPYITDKLGDSLMGYVDFVWYLWADVSEKDGPVRKLLTRDQGIYRAKTRGRKFAEAMGPVVVDPTLPEIFDLYVESEIGQKKATKGGKK